MEEYEKKFGPVLRHMWKTLGQNKVAVMIYLSPSPAEILRDQQGLDRAARLKLLQTKHEALKLAFLQNADVPFNSLVKQRTSIQSSYISNSISILEDVLTKAHIEILAKDKKTLHLEVIRKLNLSGDSGCCCEKLPVAPTPTVTENPFLDKIGVKKLWKKGILGSRALVCVIDTDGFNYDHPDISQQVWTTRDTFGNVIRGTNIDDGNSDPKHQGKPHGTSMLGLISGNGSLGFTTGVAHHAKLMLVKSSVFPHLFHKAYEFALEHKAHVICMAQTEKHSINPLEVPDYVGYRLLSEAIGSLGIVHINSIGNNGHLMKNELDRPHNVSTPGDCPPPWSHPFQKQMSATGEKASAISCGKSVADRNGSTVLESTSSSGSCQWDSYPYFDYPFHKAMNTGLIKPDICAPIEGIYSTWAYYDHDLHSSQLPYQPFDGTSAAAGIVTGAIALLVDATLRSKKPVLPERIQEALEMTAVPIRNQRLPKQNGFGSGLIQIDAAYDYGRRRLWWD